MPTSQPSQFTPDVPDWLTTRLHTTGLRLPTSGSTGTPKLVDLPAAALRASVDATTTALGAGHWVLALPLSHIAGWQVVCRAVITGHQIAAMTTTGFTAARFIAAVNQLPTTDPWFTALVPTQLHRILANPAATACAATASAILIGGAQLPETSQRQARTAGLRIVRTYGMTETCGGCVYDGVPLPGVQLALGDAGNVMVTGPMLAAGYVDAPQATAAAFPTLDGRRWHTTNDAGTITDGVLAITGRLDDVINTGGEKVHPTRVENVLVDHPTVAGAVVCGIPDPQWGQQVVALVEPHASAWPATSSDAVHLAADLTAHCRTQVRPFEVPKEIRWQHIPRTALGKVDRRAAVTAWAATSPNRG